MQSSGAQVDLQLKTITRRADCHKASSIDQGLPHKTILTACLANIGFWVQEYGISVKLRPNMLSVVKTEALVKMCQDANADTYLSGPLGRAYLDEEAFKKAGIEVRYHDYQMQPYPQLHGDFIPNLSVLDAWMMQKELP